MSGGDAPLELALPHYPALVFLARRGLPLVWIAAALVLLASVAATVLGHGPWWAVAGLAGAGAIAFLGRLLVDIARLLADTLIPG